jgi:hypothetical protein
VPICIPCSPARTRDSEPADREIQILVMPLEIRGDFKRRFKSEVQQCSIDDMAERTAGERVGVKGFSRRRRCEHSEHP